MSVVVLDDKDIKAIQDGEIVTAMVNGVTFGIVGNKFVNDEDKED